MPVGTCRMSLPSTSRRRNAGERTEDVRGAGEAPGLDAEGVVASVMDDQAPQSGHLPSHFGDCAPHAVQV